MTDDEALSVLRLTRGYSPDQLRQAYLDLVRVWHPDRFQAEGRLRQRAERTLQELNEAYAVLKGSRTGGAEAEPEPIRRSPPPPTSSSPDVASLAHADAPAPNRAAWRLSIGSGVAIGVVSGLLIAVGLVYWSDPTTVSVPESLSAQNTGNDVPLSAPTPAASARPRPTSGTEILPPGRTGGGSLVVHNAGRLDAVVVLADSTTHTRAVYVRANERLTILNVGTGTYRVLIMTGQNWNTDHFTADASYQELEQPVEFAETDVGNAIEYTRLTISFQPVVIGATGMRRTPPFRLATTG